MDQPRRAFIFDLEQIHSASTAALPRRGARLPRHASGDVEHDGAAGELFVKGGMGGAPGDIVLIFEGRYRCKWDPSNEAHRKRDLNLEIFAGEPPRRRFFRVAKNQKRELARIAAAGDEEPTLRASYPRQGLNATGITSRIAAAGTKYLTMSLSPSVV